MKPLPILIKLVCWNQHEKLNIKFQQNLRYWVTDGLTGPGSVDVERPVYLLLNRGIVNSTFRGKHLVNPKDYGN